VDGVEDPPRVAARGERPCIRTESSRLKRRQMNPRRELPRSSQAAGPRVWARAGSVHAAAPSEVVAVVLESLSAAEMLMPETLVEFGEAMRLFAAFCEEGHGLTALSQVGTEHASGFVRAPRRDGREPTPATMHVRRGAIRLLYREARRLGLASGDPTIDLHLPPRSSLAARALTDDEIELCRSYALNSLTDLRRPLAWALSECSARTSEIPRARVRDLDLEGMRIYLHGAPRVDERWAPITNWAARLFHRRLVASRLSADPDAPLLAWRAKVPKTPRAAASMAVIETLRAAGLHSEPDVRPRSILAWRGHQLLDEGLTIDQVALALGFRRLDQAAEVVGFEWRTSGGGLP
jgi:integrase